MKIYSLFAILLIFLFSCSEKKEIKNIKILWFKNVYNKELKQTLPETFINTNFIKNCSEQEKAIIAYLSILNGSECKYKNESECLSCELTDALNINCQGSKNQIDLIKKWFKNKAVLDNLKSIYSVPYTATSQSIYSKIDFYKNGDSIFVKYDLDHSNLREMNFSKSKDSIKFLILDNDIKIFK